MTHTACIAVARVWPCRRCFVRRPKTSPAFRRHRKTNKSCGVELSVEDCASWQEKSRERLAPCKTSAPASLPLRLHDAVGSTTAAVVCILGLIFDFLNTTAGFYRCTTAVRAVITSVSVETIMRCDQWRRQGGEGKLPPYGWTSKNYVIYVCAFIVMELLRNKHSLSQYHTTNTLQGRQAKEPR